MRKLTVAQAAAVFAIGCAVGNIGYRLSGHQVGVAYIAAIVVGTLSVGLAFAARPARTVVFTCPEGCGVVIDATGSSGVELDRLRALAVDHSKHGPTV